MWTRILVLGVHTLLLMLGLMYVTWAFSTYVQLLPIYVAVALYWLYSAWQILTGRDAETRKVEEMLNRRQR
jgi:threonine/homoserine/homoserine lactone efflux protein